MMGPVLPPFEVLYRRHRDEVFAFLVRRMGRDKAEDAFQETFLRALRGYSALRHDRHLRAWLYTIAARVAADEGRRRPAPAHAGEASSVDRRPAYAELEHLTVELPPAERAAVVLRYGYDLSYEDIGAALGSGEQAARQAASSGVRRLRRKGVHVS
jgi:RNA polymerase sigma factor (sigma-70 family)